MTHEWVHDVIDDLLSYAHCNGLPALAEQLEQARIVAAVELAQPDASASRDEAVVSTRVEALRHIL